MGMMKTFAHNFLEDRGGQELGYDWESLPNLKDLDRIIKNQIPVWEYKGMTEREYYGGKE